MGAIGINFGNPTSGQGFDVTTTVNEIVSNLQAIETPWKTQLTTLQGKDTAFTSIGTDLASLSTAAQSLTDFEGVLSSKQGSSSNTDVVALTSAGTTAVAGSHTVNVTALATTASYYSDTVANASDLLTGSFTITFGSGASAKTQTISAAAGGETLGDLADSINSANAGVTASVIDGGAELTLVSNTSGAAGNFTLAGTLTDSSSNNATISLDNVGQSGADASLTVDNIAVDSASNTISDAIQGITFQILATGSSQIEITNDNSSVESAVSTFVSDYNTVIGDLNTQEGKDASGNAEPLYGDPTVATLQESLQSALDFTQPAQAVGTTTAIASGDTLSGSLSISVGGGSATTVSVPAGPSDTLADLATAINNANLGATATVITSGTAATLSLINSTSGSTGAITVDSSALTDTTSGDTVSFGNSVSSAVTSITQLGISVNNDGSLTLDTDTLDSLLNTNYQDVVNFFQPSATYNSFGGNFTATLNNLANTGPDGAIYLALQEDQSQETAINTNITNENTQISTEQANLTTELNEANYELQQIPAQLDEINEIYSSITGYDQNPSG